MADEETPDVPGHAEQNVGAGEGQESDIPVGVDALTDDQIAAAEAAGPAGGGDGGDDGGDDGGALDVSALMDDSGDAGDDAADDAGDDAAADAGDDAAADAGDDAADDGGDDAGDDATPDDDVAGPDAAEEA